MCGAQDVSSFISSCVAILHQLRRAIRSPLAVRFRPIIVDPAHHDIHSPLLIQFTTELDDSRRFLVQEFCAEGFE